MRKLLFTLLILIVIIIGLLHIFTPPNLFLYHDTYRRLSYFPIVMGAIWFGVWGGISIAVLSSIFFIPHILLYLGQGPETYLSELTEIFLYLAAGSVTGIITSREAKLRQQYQRLSEKLEKSYARLHKETQLLIEAEEQLSASQKFSALGKLSTSLAHEIKNPLSSIKGTAEILLDEFPENHPKREFIQILLKEVARLNITVEEVLQYSRGHRSKEASEESLSQILSQVTRLLQSQLRKKSITLETVPDQTENILPIDGGKLSQVLLNIILNAIDAVPKGGMVKIQTTKEKNGFSVAVLDNGQGVPLEDQERIFTPFFSGKEDGTGLGLSISRKIVESYGGTLSVSKSDLGGACFTVYIPVSDSFSSEANVHIQSA